MPVMTTPMVLLRYEVQDLTGTDHRADEISIENLGSENHTRALISDPPLLPDHQYQIRIAVVSPEPESNNATSPWSEYSPLTLLQQRIANITVIPNPTPYLMGIDWAYTLPVDVLIPAIDLEFSADDLAWFTLNYDAELASIAIDAKTFNAITASAYVNHPLMIRARIRLAGDTDWFYSDSVALPEQAPPVFYVYWRNELAVGNGLWIPLIDYLKPNDKTAAFDVEIDGHRFNIIADWPPVGTLFDWLALAPTEFRDSAIHSIAFILTETDINTRAVIEYRIPAVLRYLYPDPILPAPQINTIIIDGLYGVIIVDLVRLALFGVTVYVTLSINESIVGVKQATADVSRFIFQTASLPEGYTLVTARAAAAHQSTITSANITSTKAYYRKPAVPSRVNEVAVELLSAGDAVLPDQIRLTWTPGRLVQLIVVVANKVYVLGYADSTESETIIDDTRALLQRTGALISVQFGVRAYSRIAGLSDTALAPAVSLQTLPPIAVDSHEIGPRLTYSAYIAALSAESGESVARIDQILRDAFLRIKEIVAKGGSVDLDYFGRFAANWKAGTRNAAFSINKAFTLGVNQGVVLP